MLASVLTSAFNVSQAYVHSETALYDAVLKGYEIMPMLYTTIGGSATVYAPKLLLETDKHIYRLGGNVIITLTNIGSQSVEILGYPAWQIFTYPEEEPVYPQDFAYLSWRLGPGENDTFAWNQHNEFTKDPVLPRMYVVRDTQAWNLSTHIEIIAADIVVPDNYSTIQKAIDAAGERDTIFVRSRTYYEHITVTKTVSLVGENKETTIIDGSGFFGVDVLADNVTIRGFTVRNGETYGVVVESDYNTVVGNIIANNSWGGICLRSCGNNLLAANEVTGNNATWGSLFLDYAYGNTLVGNIVRGNRFDGICLYGSSGNNLTGNTVTDHILGTGIFLILSNNNFLRNNTMIDNKYNFGVMDGFFQDVDDSNRVDDKPMVYLVNKANITVQGDAGYVAAVKCANITVQNLNLRNGRQGIMFFRTTNSTLKGNAIKGNWYGIYLVESSGNKIYHNNFINNVYQVISDSINVWDGGYPSGGNCWSDYAGVDFYRGPYQNETGSDGIGDEPYVVDRPWINLDNYPLMGPYVDVNYDGIVDILDISFVAEAYGFELGDPDFEPDADIDCNDVINILDVAMVAIWFGHKWQDQ